MPLLTLRVTPNASHVKIVQEEGGALKVYVTCPPEDGKANKAVIALLAKYFSRPKSAFTLIKGEKGRDKIVRLEA